MSKFRNRMVCGSLSFAMSLLVLSPSASALLLDLLPSGDQWIRSTDGSTAFTSDAISVRDASISGDARWGILQFDLSATGFTGADLLSASLDLNVRSNSDDGGQNALLIDITSGTQAVDSVTWDQYQIDHAGNETPWSTLGNIAAGTALTGGTVVNTAADAGDLAAIASTIDGANGSLLTFVFAPLANTNVDWTDGPGQLDNKPSVLRLEFPGGPLPCGSCEVGLSAARWARDGQSLANDGVLVTNNEAVVGGAPTVGLMEWDLSQIPEDPAKLIAAELTFTVADASRTTDPGQIAGLIDTTGMTPITGLGSRQDYDAAYGGTEQMLEGLGVVPDATGALGDGETFTTTATPADLQLIRDVLNGSDLLTMALLGSDGATPDGVTGQYWGDGAFGAAPVLKLTFIPEPTSAGLLGIVLTMLPGCPRRRW